MIGLQRPTCESWNDLDAMVEQHDVKLKHGAVTNSHCSCPGPNEDMRISSELTAAMDGCGLRPDLPTIFVAECVT